MTAPISYKPKDIPAVTGIAYTRIREAIDSEELPAVDVSANRKVVMHDDLVAWLESLRRTA